MEKEIKRKVDEIIAISGDDEAAHSEEDRLHLMLIDIYCPESVKLEIKRLSDSEFNRWCA